MIKFLKNLFESLADKKFQQDTTLIYNRPEYTGPKEFANKPAVDYLLKHVKYQPLPELTGRAIAFQSLFSIEEDIQKAVTTRTKSLAANDSDSYNSLWQAIIEVYNDKYFPAELIVREACLTNLHNEGESCVYSHRYFYF